MQLKLVKSLTTIGLGFCLTPFFSGATKAEITNSFTSKSAQPQLISQAEGHDLYAGEEQIGCGLAVGHVVAKSGTIGFIVFPDGGHLHTDTGAVSGDDVLIDVDDNGNYFLVDVSHPAWISHLESEYGWRRLDYYCGSYTSLTDRTSGLWAQLESRPTTRTEIPPRPTPPARPYTPPSQPEPQPEPVRGLW